MRSRHLWTLSAIAGLAGALVLYGASTGINWTAVTVIAAFGLIVYRRPDAVLARALAIPLGFAVLLSGAFAVTSSGFLLFADLVIVTSLLALALLIGREPERAATFGAVYIVTAPFRGLAWTVRGAISSVAEAFETTRIANMHPVLRGSLVAIPVVTLFALLFAAADPLFASGRDAVYSVFGSWSVSPRIIFGLAVTLFVAGAYSASLPIAAARTEPAAASTGTARLTERRVVLFACAGICWLFVLLQMGYLFFGNPGAVGSGMTFAQYAHRGFGELALAATIAALVIVATHNNEYFPAPPARMRSPLALPSLLLLAAVVCVLASAFHRVSLYENAYGFSVQRVYAQAYMVLTLAVLALVAWQVLHTFDARALARNVMLVALVTFAFVLYWNRDAWVVRANVDRFAATGKLDVNYLAGGLSPDGYPALVKALPRMTPADSAKAVAELHTESQLEQLNDEGRWFEWNFRRASASNALRTLGPALHAE